MVQNYDELCTTLCEILRPLAEPGTELHEGTELVADLALNSLKILDLLMEVEDRLDISVPMNILPEVRTIGDLATELGKLVDAAH